MADTRSRTVADMPDSMSPDVSEPDCRLRDPSLRHVQAHHDPFAECQPAGATDHESVTDTPAPPDRTQVLCGSEPGPIGALDQAPQREALAAVTGMP